MMMPSIHDALDRSISRFDPTIGAIVAIPSFTRMLAHRTINGADGHPLPTTTVPCSSYQSAVEASAFADLIAVFDDAFPQKDLMLSLAGTAHTISLDDAARLYERASSERATPAAGIFMPDPCPGEVFALAPTLVLHRRNKSKRPLAVMISHLQAVRSDEDIVMKATPIAVFIEADSNCLEPVIATVVGYLLGMYLGDFAMALQFDGAKRCLYQVLPQTTAGDIDPETIAFDAVDLERFALHAFAEWFPTRTINDDQLDAARLCRMPKQPGDPEHHLAELLRGLSMEAAPDGVDIDARDSALLQLDLHFNLGDMYPRSASKRMQAFAPRARQLDVLFATGAAVESEMS